MNPDIISAFSLVVAFLFVAAVSVDEQFIAWLFLLVHFSLDGLDGAIAKRFALRRTAKERKHGEFVDIAVDRAAEGILFIIPPFFLPWFPLFLVNIVLAILTLRTRRAFILPLRFLFFIVFTISLLF